MFSPKKHILGVASGKGGVGKSTTAVNLAIALASFNQKVGIVDADIYGPSIPTLMGVEGAPIVSETTKKMIPWENYGVKCMSMGFLVPHLDSPIVWRGPMASNALKELLFKTEWGNLDILVVDFPPGTGDIQITLSQSVALSGSVIVSTPQDLALVSAVKGLNMFRKVDVPILGIIENMSYFQCGKCSDKNYIFGKQGVAREKAAAMNVPFLGEVPITPQTVAPVTAMDPDSEISKPYFDIARLLIEELSKQVKTTTTIIND